MTTKRRRNQPYPRSGARRAPVSRRRRTSTASTFGTAVGIALAAVLATVFHGLAWWGWVLIILVGLVVGLVWAARKGRAAAPPVT
ncbi:hypothetical protein [Pseudonocardia sp. GCM10023141]|uniref:hypothetical protein n=1 Tax=Pseudonocardia sp. GCM10023141 TaxID=3252653 RepID=UPI00360E8599